jgi:phenolic acid decarboxylase
MQKTLLIIGFFLAISPLFSQVSNSLATEEYLLDGISFTYQYQSGSAIDISFEDGKLTYQWIAGKNAGKPAKTYPYKSRKLDTDIYLVSWHEPKLKNYITLVYNLKNNTCANSVIVKYGTEKSFLAFEGGIIEHVKRKN